VPLTAACSSLLLVATLVGFAVGMSSGPGESTRAASSPVATALPLRVPEVEVTMTARPTPTHKPSTGPRTAQPPSAAQRDRELAAVAAAAGSAVQGTGSMSTPMPIPVAPVAGDPLVGDPSVPAVPEPPVADPVAPADPVAAADPSAAAADFVISSFNVLGSSHTRGGGGRASGVVRITGVAQLLSRHAVDVAGFQELQADQARALLGATAGAWSLYPGAGPGKDSENSVGWRNAKFRLVRGTKISIPYFNGHHRRMPVVLLEDRSSGVRAWVGNFHNPAETSRYHRQQKWRTQATYLEAALANRTAASGVPLFVTGDMNERAEYFCRFTGAAASMVAARGGSNGPGGCSAGRPRAVDWIFGSRGVAFSGYDEDRTHLVDVTTDHPVISSRVRVSASVFPQALTAR
jgi:endonuclease/exonuclease/phosphatase family metal-dependent hydrolase